MNERKFEFLEGYKKNPPIKSSLYEVEKDISSDFESIYSTESPKRGKKEYGAENTNRGISERRSRNLCLECARNKASFLESQRKYALMNEKLAGTEKHLKQYDSLLSIKEKRLQEQEISLKTERDALVSEKAIFEQTKQQENCLIMEKSKEVMREKGLVEARLKELNDKYNDVKGMILENENNKAEIIKTIKKELSDEYLLKEKVLQQREEELATQEKIFYQRVKLKESELQENEKYLNESQDALDRIETSLRVKEEELDELQKKLNDQKEEIVKEIRYKENELKNKEAHLENEKDQLGIKIEILNEELERISYLKGTLENQKSLFEEKNTEFETTIYLEIEEVKANEKAVKEKELMLIEKEKSIEKIMKKLKAEQDSIEERWSALKNIEKIANELEYYKAKTQELECDSHNASLPENYTDKVAEIANILSEKLEILNKREVELNNLEEKLKLEREEINKTTILVANLNEDLAIQRQSQIKDHFNIQSKKDELKKFEIQLTDREALLSKREREINQAYQKMKSSGNNNAFIDLSMSSVESISPMLNLNNL